MGVLDGVARWFRRGVRRPELDEVLTPEAWAGWPAAWSTSWRDLAHSDDNLGTVWSCVDRITSALSTMPLAAYTNRRPMIRPPRWLADPPASTYTHTGEAVEELLTSLLTSGNAYAYVLARDAYGFPSYWTVLPPDRVTVDPDGRTYHLGGDASSIADRGRTVVMTGDPHVDDVLHIRYQARAGTPYGLAPLDSVRRQLASLNGMETISANLATRAGIPSGILSADAVIDTDQAKEYKARWIEQMNGGEIAVLGNGLRFNAVSLNPKDLALLELRQVDGRMIAVAFGVPPFMVGLSEAGDLTYSTVQGQMDYFWRSTLRPLSVNVSRSLSRWLPRGSVVTFDADAYVQPPLAEFLPALGDAVTAGILSADEAREAIGYAAGAPSVAASAASVVAPATTDAGLTPLTSTTAAPVTPQAVRHLHRIDAP